MVGWLIIVCEIAFWLFVLAGLVTRYILKMKPLGGLLLLCTPLIDLILIFATIIDLRDGDKASVVHGLAAVYIGVTIAYGKRMIQWADERFAYWFAKGDKPTSKPKYGTEHAKYERQGWYRSLLGWTIGNALIFMIIFLVNDHERTKELYKVVGVWTSILVVDFLWSFSYTIFPKKPISKDGTK
jgi:hypothetical protein